MFGANLYEIQIMNEEYNTMKNGKINKIIPHVSIVNNLKIGILKKLSTVNKIITTNTITK
ncbi:MAG: hypothetical protein LBB45_01410 [Methanobrevibacter sp.]|nr:hypothetical protein [Candidatus Methanovirga basalitermitum]